VAAGAASVELVSDAGVLDRRDRSRPPTVRVTAPGRGARVGPRGALAVRWTSSDPDGGALRATVEYAPNGSSAFRTVFQGPDRGATSIPGRFLEGAAGARVRVTVDDGFNEAGALSAPFFADGSAPAARIVVPAVGDALQAGRVLLVGSARDDRRQRLRGGSLTWFAGARRLGSGERLRTSLGVGRVTLRLRARDARGRVSTASLRVRVAPVMLQVRTLSAPDRVRRGARTVPVRVATSLPASLRAGGRTFRVGPVARTLAVPLPARPVSGVLRVALRVAVPGQRPLAGRVVVFRR
jgi:hypothetical protein